MTLPEIFVALPIDVAVSMERLLETDNSLPVEHTRADIYVLAAGIVAQLKDQFPNESDAVYELLDQVPEAVLELF